MIKLLQSKIKSAVFNSVEDKVLVKLTDLSELDSEITKQCNEIETLRKTYNKLNDNYSTLLAQSLAKYKYSELDEYV